MLDAERAGLEHELLSFIPTGLGVFDVTGEIVEMRYLNDGYYQMIGSSRATREQFGGPRVLQAVYEDDRAGLLREAQHAIQEKRVLQAHFRVLSGNGRYIWVGIRASHRPLNSVTERFFASYYDIDALKRREDELQIILHSERMLADIARLLNEPYGYSSHIDEVLAKLGTYLEADRTYIFVSDEGNTTGSNTNEWCKKGIIPQKDLLQHVDIHFIDRWLPFFKKGRCVVVPDIEEIRLVQRNEYELMSQQGIRSYVEAPLFLEGKAACFVGIDNPAVKKIRHASELLLSMAYFISSAMSRENITDLYKNQAKTLRLSEERERDSRRVYEASVEGLELFIWKYDLLQRRITLMDNPYTQRKSKELGIPRVIDNVPDCLMSQVDEENGRLLRNMYAEVAAGKPKTSCTIRYMPHGQQTTLVLRITYTTSFDTNGKPRIAYGSSQNVTKQLETENEYRQEIDFFNTSQEQTLIAKGHHSLTRNSVLSLVRFSEKAQKLKAGASYDDACCEFISMAQSGGDQDRLADIFDRRKLIDRFMHGQTNFSYTYKRKRELTTTVWVRTEIRCFENITSSDVECFIYTYDVTKKHLEETVVQRLTELGYDAIGVINALNKSCTYYGDTKDIDNIHDEMDYEECLQAAICNVPQEQRAKVSHALSYSTILAELDRTGRYAFAYDRLEDGGSLHRKFLQYCYLDKSEKLIFFCKSDISAQYAQEQANAAHLREALVAAERANDAKTAFLSRISHDIRTPIGIISNMTSFAYEDVGNTAKLRGDLDKIVTSTEFLLSLINDVLDISKIDSGKIELELVPYSYADYVKNIQNMLDPLCQQKKLRYEIVNDGAVPSILVDKVRLNQITFNLLSNAVKYTPEGGKIFFRARGRMRSDGKVDCSITVQDSGIGMSREFQKTMFEPFSQEFDNPRRSPVEVGTGLGLSIVKKMVDLFGGKISVQSERNHGTAITIQMCASQPAANRSEEHQNQTSASAAGWLGGKVLLVEDNDINAEIAMRIFESFGTCTKWVDNGAKAVKCFATCEQGEYLAIMMDIQMPIMNGFAATEAIRALPRPDAKTIPIIAMTADAFSTAIEHSKACGMNAFVTKPIVPAELRAIVEQFASRKGPVSAQTRRA